MRPSLMLVLAAVLAVSGCASAQGSPSVLSPSPPATVPAVSPTTAPAQGSSLPSALASSTTPSTAPSPAPSTSPTSSLASASPTPSTLVPSSVAAGPAPVGTFVLGDSIILGAGVGPRLAEFGYAVVGVVGQSATEAYLRTHLSSDLAQSARHWVIELGTNNSGDPGDVGRLAGLVDVIDSLRTPGARQKVSWVTPYRPPAYSGGKSAHSLDAFTAELVRLAGEKPWLRLIDWAGVARWHDEWFAQDSMHLHPDATGQAVLLAMIAGPDAAPAAIPSPLFSGPFDSEGVFLGGPAEEYVEPETFDNSTLPPPATPSTPVSPTPTPSPAPSSDADQGLSSPQSLDGR